MKNLAGIETTTSYVFDKAARTVTLSGLTEVLTYRNLLLINNATANTIVYSVSDPSKTAVINGNVITLAYDTSSMNNTDSLQIYMDFADTGKESLEAVMRTLLARITSSGVVTKEFTQRVAVEAIPASLPIINSLGFGPYGNLVTGDVLTEYPFDLSTIDTTYPPEIDLISADMVVNNISGNILDSNVLFNFMPGDFIIAFGAWEQGYTQATLAQSDGRNCLISPNVIHNTEISYYEPFIFGYSTFAEAATNAVFRLHTASSFTNRTLLVMQFRPRPGVDVSYGGYATSVSNVNEVGVIQTQPVSIGEQNTLVIAAAASDNPSTMTDFKIGGLEADNFYVREMFAAWYKRFYNPPGSIVGTTRNNSTPYDFFVKALIVFQLSYVPVRRHLTTNTSYQVKVGQGPVDQRWDIINSTQIEYAMAIRSKLSWGTLTVIYDGNGNTGGTVPVDNNVYYSGDEVIAKQNSGNLVNE